MDVRIPLPINSNPGMVMPPRKFTTVNDVAHFAAQIVNGIMQHKETIDNNELPRDRAASREKNQPLCMAQYYRLLGSCRRPGDPRDSQYLPERRDDQHVIVCCRNQVNSAARGWEWSWILNLSLIASQMYCVPVKAGDRGRLSEEEIASQLLFILSDAPCLPTKPAPVGLLTAEPRSIWARDRAVLLQNEQNQRNIELIEQALVLICLDESLPVSFNANRFSGATPSVHMCGARVSFIHLHSSVSVTATICFFLLAQDETNMAHEMIHGGGSDSNTANRWFDKTMQVMMIREKKYGHLSQFPIDCRLSFVTTVHGVSAMSIQHPKALHRFCCWRKSWMTSIMPSFWTTVFRISIYRHRSAWNGW